MIVLFNTLFFKLCTYLKKEEYKCVRSETINNMNINMGVLI